VFVGGRQQRRVFIREQIGRKRYSLPVILLWQVKVKRSGGNPVYQRRNVVNYTLSKQ
jgi:hypothetical protein